MSSNQSIANTTISTQQNRGNGYRQNNGNGNAHNNNSNPPGSHHNDTSGGTQTRNRSQGRTTPSTSTSWHTNLRTRNASGNPPQQRPDTSRTVFKGANDDMHGNIFGFSEDQCDRRHFTKTVTALQQVANKLPNSAHFQTLFKTTPALPIIAEPKAPPVAKRTEVQELIFKEEITQYVRSRSQLTSNLVAIWTIIMGQCTDTMKAKLESMSDFDDKETARDCAWLLATILTITLQFDNRRYSHNTLLEAYQKFFNCRQSPTQSVDDYRKTLISWCDIIEHYGGSIVFNTNLALANDPITDKPRTTSQRQAAAKQEFLAMSLLRGSDATRYGSLLHELSNQFAAGRDHYPKDLLSAYSLLLEYTIPTNARPRESRPDNRPANPPNTPNPPNPPGGSANPPRDTAATNPSAPSASISHRHVDNHCRC